MSTKKLTPEELKETNGGSLLGGNDSSSMSDLGAGLNIDNLASFSSESSDGDEHESSSTSLGNGIGFGTSKSSNQSSQ